MPAVNLSPFGIKPQFELSSGLPAVGAQLFFYVGGSVNTKLNTYTDSTGNTANPNPIVLNSLGMPTNGIWFASGLLYKVVYAPVGDTDPPTSPIFTIDNVSGINDTSTTIDQWIPSGVTPTFVNTTSFTLPGDQTTAFHIGRRLKTTISAGTGYHNITNSVFGALTTVTVNGTALDSGLSAVSLGLLTVANPSLPYFAANYYATSVAGTNTITGTVTGLNALFAGLRVSFIPANTNTAAATFNVNALGAKSIFSGGVASVGSELRATIPVELEYDGVQWHILGPFSGGAIPGRVTMPGQPAFLANITAATTDVTGDGTPFIVNNWTEIVDQNGDFSASTFTAPIAGTHLYRFDITVSMLQLGAAHTKGLVQISTSNRTYIIAQGNFGAMRDVNNELFVNGSVLADMESGDLATATVTISGGTKTVDIGNGATAASFFSGMLVA